MVNSKTIIAIVVVVILFAIVSFAYISGNSHDTKINVISNSTLKNGDSIIVELTDQYRNVYPGEQIYIKILDDSGWAERFNGTTDNNGQVSVKIQGLENGNYTLHCNYNGTLFNKEDYNVSPLTIDDGYEY